MTTILWLIYLLFGVIIIAPLIQGDLFRVDNKYKTFRYVSITLLLWWIIDFIRLITPNGVVLYYLTLLIFPTVYLFIFIFYVAIKRYFNSKIHPVFNGFLVLFFIVNFFLSATNNLHQLVMIMEPSTTIVYNDMLDVEMGIFFQLHTFISYILIVIIIIYILKNVIERLRTSQDIWPFIFLITSFIFGITINMYQVFINTLILDPTLLTVSMILAVLYYIFYIRDLKLLLGFNRNIFILNHLREKYVIVDELGFVVDASNEFTNQFGISLADTISYEDLLIKMKETAVLFEDTDKIGNQYHPDKIYLNTLKKEIILPFYKHSGTFYLFFDQTADFKYVYDMNYIKTHDLMTEIYNRNFLEELRDQIDDNDSIYQVTLFDVDGLKLINDYLGHNQGDAHLKRFAKQLELVSKEKDTYPIRLGGDEFILLSINKDVPYMESLVQTVQKENDKLPFIDKVQFSYSIKERNDVTMSLKEVLGKADEGMYLNKKSKANYKELLEKQLQEITQKK